MALNDDINGALSRLAHMAETRGDHELAVIHDELDRVRVALFGGSPGNVSSKVTPPDETAQSNPDATDRGTSREATTPLDSRGTPVASPEAQEAHDTREVAPENDQRETPATPAQQAETTAHAEAGANADAVTPTDVNVAPDARTQENADENPNVEERKPDTAQGHAAEQGIPFPPSEAADTSTHQEQGNQ